MVEKKWFQSKKFIAFLIMEALLGGMAIVALLRQDIEWPLSVFMAGTVLTMGAIAFGFNGQQAALDKYLRGMALQAKLGQGETEITNADIQEEKEV